MEEARRALAARQIEIYALTESLSLAMSYLTRPVASLWLSRYNLPRVDGALAIIVASIA